MRSFAGALTSLGLAAVLVAGCRRETPIERGAREFRARQKSRIEQAQLQTKLFAMLPDRDMVLPYRRDGLGLGIRPAKTELRMGEPLRLHLVFEDFDGRNPVPVCTGFSLTGEEVQTGLSTTVDVPVGCSMEESVRESTAHLKRGELRSAEVSTDGTKLRFDQPGRYIVQAAWQPSRSADALLAQGEPYRAVASNLVMITVQ